MKSFLKMWFVSYIVLTVINAGLLILLMMWAGREFSLPQKLFWFLSFPTIFTLTQLLVARSSVFPQIKYLENSDITKPSIKDISSTVYDLQPDVDFSNLKTKIAEKWVITFSDHTSNVLKFRSKFDFKSWCNYSLGAGPAAWLKLDCEAGKINLVCFSMVSDFHKKHIEKMQEEFEGIIKNTAYH